MKRNNLYLVVAIVQLLFFCFHAIAYYGFVSAFELQGVSLFITKIIFFLGSLIFLAASLISHKFENVISRSLYKLSSVWLAVLFYAVFASGLYAIGLIFILFFQIPIVIEWFGIGLYGAASMVVLYGFYNASRIRIKRIRVAIPNLPEVWRGRTAVFVSDIHVGQVRGVSFVEKIVKIIQSINPDIVFIGGDLYDGVKVDEKSSIEPLQKLSSKFGTYFVTGNHEYISDSEKYTNPIKAAGIMVLDNEVVDIEGLKIIGVDYHDTVNEESFDAVLRKLSLDKAKPSILLKHTPFFIDTTEKYGINLQLSGHTHRGQLFPGNLVTKKMYKSFDYDLKNKGNLQVYTSSGVGTWGPPARVGTQSEVVHITFV